MILSDTAIKRPVFTTMVLMAIIVFGLISFQTVGIDWLPKVDIPVITVLSQLPGADPETIETTVTDVIEEAVSSISMIKEIRSTSADGFSQVIVEFELEKDVDVAYQEVQAKIGTVRSDLPDDLEEPIIEKFDIDSAPVMAVIVSGDQSIRELTRISDKVVKQRLQRVPNVGQVKLIGDREREIWLWLDRERLEGYGLTVQDVEQALRTEHVEYPGGRVETGPLEYIVKTKAEFETAEEFEKMVVAYRNEAPIRVRDIGWVEDGLQEERSIARLDGQRAVSMLVRRQSGTNTVEVCNDLKKELAQLEKELAPQGIQISIAQDMAPFIEDSVDEVYFHLMFGGGLAIAIVFVFLRNVRSTMISGLVIPTAVIGTFMMMNGLDFTQNMMSLLGLTLAIGLLIDDAIVVQENIMRHIEEGMQPREAAQFATSEIALAVFATTLAVVAVFVPVAFMGGIVGRFFYQFGMTVAFAVMLSMFISFTLDPMLSSRILKKPTPGPLYNLSEKGFVLMEKAYRALLAASLRFRWLTIALAIGVFIASGYMAKYLRTEFVPPEDQSEFKLRVKAPLGSSPAATDGILEDIRNRIGNPDWMEYTFSKVAFDELERANEGEIYIKMLDKRDRDIHQFAAMDWVREQIGEIPGTNLAIEKVERISGGGFKSADLQLEVRGDDLDILEGYVDQVMSFMKEAGGYRDIESSFDKNKPEVNLYINRDSAADMGVDPMTIASTVRTLIGGNDITKFKAEGDRYDISIRLQEAYRDRPLDIDRLTVRNNAGDLIHLKNLIEVREEVGPVQIERTNRARKITIYANLDPEIKVLGPAMEELNTFTANLDLPPGYSFAFVGQASDMAESFQELIFSLLLGVVLIYMVLASQFESFLHPFTIMLALPLSIIGAIGALLATGLTLSIFTMIGVILLMGLVTKNGILLVDFTNTLIRRDGINRHEALMTAGPIRLRPILMTSLAMIFGMLPIALHGSESRQPMAVAVIGGLITSTILTLIIVPAVYTVMDDLSGLVRRIARIGSSRSKE